MRKKEKNSWGGEGRDEKERRWIVVEGKDLK